MLRKSFWEKLNVLLVMLAMLMVFSGVVGADLAEKNLTEEINIEVPEIDDTPVEAPEGTFTTPYPTTAQGDDVQTAVGAWSWWWHPGDYAIGNRTTSLGSVNRLDYHMVIAENILNNGGYCDIEFYLNGTKIGDFRVVEGEFEKDLSWTFAPIAGPNYELEMVETNLVDPGKGSFRLDSDKPGQVTLHPVTLMGAIGGKVIDAGTGAPIPKAFILAVRLPTKEKDVAVTNNDGVYRIAPLVPAYYFVICFKKGYNFAWDIAKVEAPHTTIVDFTLYPAIE